MEPFFSFSILTFSAFCSSCYCFNCDFKLLQFVICIISNVLFLFSDFQSKNNLVSATPLGTGPDIYLTQVQTGLLGELGEPTNHLCLPIFSNACCLHVHVHCQYLLHIIQLHHHKSCHWEFHGLRPCYSWCSSGPNWVVFPRSAKQPDRDKRRGPFSF